MLNFPLRLAVALWFLAAAAVDAQTFVAGRVVDRAKGGPLAKVAVELLGQRDTVLGAATSSTDGSFALMAPRGGTYRVRLVAAGAAPRVSDSMVVADGQYFERQFSIDIVPRGFAVPDPYLAFQVDKLAVPTSPIVPQYPENLRAQRVSGCVLAEFVVDTTGRPDMSTLDVLAYSDRGFVDAVREALREATFVPAEVDGKWVRQLVRQPFTFTIEGDRERECKAGLRVR